MNRLAAPTGPAEQTRIEHDLLGDRAVPAAVYYGVHTLRAVENFPITGNPISIYPDLIRALAAIKQAAALANHELGLLDKERTDAIVKACEEIRAGRLHAEFVVVQPTRRTLSTQARLFLQRFEAEVTHIHQVWDRAIKEPDHRLRA